MPAKQAELDFRETYTREEFEGIAAGLIPVAMEDKWFIFFEQHTLSLHRSWTGVCVYQVEFEEASFGFAAKRAIVNRDPRQYKGTDDQYDCQFLRWLIGNLLVGKSSSFPVPDKIRAADASLYQFHQAGTMLPTRRCQRGKGE